MFTSSLAYVYIYITLVPYLSRPWEVNVLSSNDEIYCFVDPKVHYRVYWSLFQGQMNPVHTLSPCSLDLNVNYFCL
jgi:hypothetical protein